VHIQKSLSGQKYEDRISMVRGQYDRGVEVAPMLTDKVIE
jgi:hypothetical protein